MNEFSIQGMTCQKCVAKIEKELKQSGYNEATVSLSPPKVTFQTSDVSADQVQAILSRAGNYRTEAATSQTTDSLPAAANDENLTPLFVIVSYIIGGVLLRAAMTGDFSLPSLMSNFMGGFFAVFSLFKLLNLAGFAEAYATYDLLAARSRAYALSYPFIELLLGIFYFTGFAPFFTNMATVILMAVGTVGVFQALQTKRKFQCACLGTALKLPMTKVTLIEDVTMGLMALVMLLIEH